MTTSGGTATPGRAPDRRIVLITGANKGIGLATGRELGRAGHTVLLGARDPARGTAAARALADEGLDAVFVRLDVTDTGVIDAAAAFIEGAYGRLDILVNNAGVSRDRPHSPAELPVARLREIYEVNVLGVVAVTNAMLPLLRKSRAGYIGNVSSGLGTVAFLTDPASTTTPGPTPPSRPASASPARSCSPRTARRGCSCTRTEALTPGNGVLTSSALEELP
jgi:NAD(P)-dependent dehydrogenase (short-subunit alcohol dehydrogenase family)